MIWWLKRNNYVEPQVIATILLYSPNQPIFYIKFHYILENAQQDLAGMCSTNPPFYAIA